MDLRSPKKFDPAKEFRKYPGGDLALTLTDSPKVFSYVKFPT